MVWAANRTGRVRVAKRVAEEDGEDEGAEGAGAGVVEGEGKGTTTSNDFNGISVGKSMTLHIYHELI